MDKVRAQLEALPTFAAILEREPETRALLRSRLEAAVDSAATAEGIRDAGFSISYELLQSRLVYYLIRARDSDLINVQQTQLDFMGDLLQRDPQFCYYINYNPSTFSAISDVGVLRQKYGGNFFDRIQGINAVAIRNATDEIPSFDAGAANLGVQAAGQAMIEVLGPENIGLITKERKAQTIEEATLACRATIALLESLLATDDPASASRHLFILSQQQ